MSRPYTIKGEPMTFSTFQSELRASALKYLEMESLSIAELAKRSGYNYHSMRNAVHSLRDDGLIKPVSTHNYRNVKFTLGTDDGPNNIIPLVRTETGAHKLQILLELRKNEKIKAAEAITRIPMHVTRILKAAMRIDEGRTDAALTLESIKIEMTNDLNAVKQAVSIYEQVLSDARIWDAQSLKRFPYDTSFSASDVDLAYREYFREE